MNIALPLELNYLGLAGCHLLVSPDIPSGASSVLGTSSWGFDMPGLPELYGLEFFNQAFFLDPGVNPANVVGSNAGRGKIGS